MWDLAGFIQGAEWVFVVVIAVVLIFGARRIPELAKTFGRARGEFEKGKMEGEKELRDLKEKDD